MKTTTSKVPTIENWSRDTTIRIGNQLFTLAKQQPEEFKVLVILLLEQFQADLQRSRDLIWKLSDEKAKLWQDGTEQYDTIVRLEDKVRELEQRLKQHEQP